MASASRWWWTTGRARARISRRSWLRRGLPTGASAYVKLSFNALRDFAPVSQVSATPHILVTHPSLPPRTVKELIAFTRARPGELNFSSTGHGNSDHLAAELFNFMTGLKMVHVTYKGGPQAMGDVVSGQIAMYFAGVPVSLPFVTAGRVRALGVTGAKRSAVLPDVPTIAEAGVPGYEHILWGMLLVPAATPKDVVARLNREAVKALEAADVRERYSGMGVEPAPSTPEQAGAYLKSETDKYAKVVKAIALRIEESRSVKKEVPSPSVFLVNHISPPCNLTTFRHIAKPHRVPHVCSPRIRSGIESKCRNLIAGPHCRAARPARGPRV